MTDPGSARPFSPAELSAIEDALEQLAHDDAFVLGPLGSAEADAAVRERLASYRAITRLTRDALAAHEAPVHVLDRVRALARDAADTVAPTSASDAPARPSFWSRIRAAWTIPMLATAAAAVLVAVIVVPARQHDTVAQAPPAITPSSGAVSRSEPAVDESIVRAEQSDQRLAMATEAQDNSELRGGAALTPTTAAEKKKGSALAEQAPAEESRRNLGRARDDDPGKGMGGGDVPTADATPKSAPAPTPKPSPQKPGASVPSGGATAPAAEPKDADSDGHSNGTALARADAARRSGDCTSAVPIYESLRKDPDRKTRARAKAGLALCAERSGDSARASDLLTSAREDDARIDDWIATQR